MHSRYFKQKINKKITVHLLRYMLSNIFSKYMLQIAMCKISYPETMRSMHIIVKFAFFPNHSMAVFPYEYIQLYIIILIAA